SAWSRSGCSRALLSRSNRLQPPAEATPGRGRFPVSIPGQDRYNPRWALPNTGAARLLSCAFSTDLPVGQLGIAMVDFVRRAQAVVSEAAAIAGTRPRDLAEAMGRFFGSINIWFWGIVGLPTLLAGVYFFAIASDLYSSEVRFIVRGPNKVPTSAISAMLSASSAVSEDAYAVHEYVMSRDAGPPRAGIRSARAPEPARGRPDHAFPRDL